MATFSKFLSTERQRLKKLMVAGQKKLKSATGELATLKRHLQALDVFEATRIGKTSRSGKRQRRGPSRRSTVLAALKGSTNGMSRNDLLQKLKMKGNKTGEQSVSNALSFLKKAGKVKSKDGQYTLT